MNIPAGATEWLADEAYSEVREMSERQIALLRKRFAEARLRRQIVRRVWLVDHGRWKASVRRREARCFRESAV